MTSASLEPTRRRWLMPASATSDATVLVLARGVRAFGDGFVSVLLPVYLTTLGYTAFRIGVITTATLLGSAALTLLVGSFGGRWPRGQLLLRASLMMVATGLGFAFVTAYVPLLIVAFLGTMNPSSGDVSIFLPTEQSLLPQTVQAVDRTALFARYTLVGSLVGAVGALAAGLPDLGVNRLGISHQSAMAAMFVLYGGLGLLVMGLYQRLSPRIEPTPGAEPSRLGPSRHVVYRLAALFSLDSFASGLALQSVLALWLFLKFDLSTTSAGTIFFWTGLCSALSQLLAPVLARRFGLINTMVFTHLPANLFLIAAPLMPNLQLAIACLLIRSTLSQMDVPARSSYVMSVVTPPERAAAASLTVVPKSLASAISPLIAGSLLSTTVFGWPLILAGTLKVTYDLTLFRLFRRQHLHDEI